MSWFTKAKEKLSGWFSGLFKKTAVRDLPVEKKQGPSKEGTLNKLARESLSLGVSELPIGKKITATVQRLRCAHEYHLAKQVWVRVATKKFELQNEVFCTKCKDSKIQAI